MRDCIRPCARPLPVCLSILFLLLGSSLAQQQVTFQKQTYSVNPQSFAIGDMNGDGAPDIVSANGQFHTVNVLLNNGDGTFQGPGLVFNAGEDPFAVALADFNGDGKLDVAVADSGADFIDVLFGTGDGSLTNRIQLPIIGHPISLAVADFNADRKPDIAATTNGTPRVTIYFEKGDTQFSAPHDFIVGDNFTESLPSIAAGDINHDGCPDLAVVACCVRDRFHNAVYRLDNQTIANQTDQPRFFQKFVESGTASSIKLVDIDKDGYADYVIPYFADPTCDGNDCPLIQGVTWIFNNPNGSTTKNGYVSTADGSYFVEAGAAVADLNGDGLNDLAVTVSGDAIGTSDAVRYLLATGPRSFAPAEFTSLGDRQAVRPLAVADFNRDGLADMVAGNNMAANVLLTQRTSSTSGGGICAAPRSPGVQICSPAPGQTQDDLTLFQASASAPAGQFVKAMRLYVDDVAQYTTNSSSLITAKELSSGAHKAVVVAWASGGGVFTSKVLTGSCLPPGAGVQICSPLANATVASPVQILATAVASAGSITAMRIYVDGRAVNTQSSNSPQSLQQITASLPIAAGNHWLAVVGYQSVGGAQVTGQLLHVK